MDPDNATFRLKWVLDWLTVSGYIVDDGPQHIVEFKDTQHIDRKEQRVEVTLEAA